MLASLQEIWTEILILRAMTGQWPVRLMMATTTRWRKREREREREMRGSLCFQRMMRMVNSLSLSLSPPPPLSLSLSISLSLSLSLSLSPSLITHIHTHTHTHLAIIEQYEDWDSWGPGQEEPHCEDPDFNVMFLLLCIYCYSSHFNTIMYVCMFWFIIMENCDRNCFKGLTLFFPPDGR